MIGGGICHTCNRSCYKLSTACLHDNQIDCTYHTWCAAAAVVPIGAAIAAPALVAAIVAPVPVAATVVLPPVATVAHQLVAAQPHAPVTLIWTWIERNEPSFHL